MGAGRRTAGSTLAELRARTALREAGLDPTVSLTRASSVTNEVWLSTTHAVRVNRRPDDRLYRESLLVPHLPAEVGYPSVVAHGGLRGEDWLVAERSPGGPLAHAWPNLATSERRSAIKQIAGRLACLHRTLAPLDLPAIERTPQLLLPGSPDPTTPVVEALHRAAHLDHVDKLMLAEAAELVAELAPCLQPFDVPTLIHGDITFENVLWHDGEVTALLDFEWARAGPGDLDLDILLRCAAYPHLHVGRTHAARTRAGDYAEVPAWLAEANPSLFEHPRRHDRLRIYSIGYDVRAVLADPPATSRPRDLPALHPHNRLRAVVAHESHIDALEKAGL